MKPAAGLSALPEPTPWDLFFDIEADPWATELGLEYLLGVVEEVDGQPRYLDIWATSQEEEKAAFERFMQLVMERLDAHPELHVYHYGGYRWARSSASCNATGHASMRWIGCYAATCSWISSTSSVRASGPPSSGIR